MEYGVIIAEPVVDPFVWMFLGFSCFCLFVGWLSFRGDK